MDEIEQLIFNFGWIAGRLQHLKQTRPEEAERISNTYQKFLSSIPPEEIIKFIKSIKTEPDRPSGGDEPKHCELCNGARGGVAGNNQIIDGKRVCDYCHADMMKSDRSSEVAALQAKIDALMLEYCPNEMTPEQVENWAKHQRKATLDHPSNTYENPTKTPNPSKPE
jgi:hypothetical protein